MWLPESAVDWLIEGFELVEAALKCLSLTMTFIFPTTLFLLAGADL